MLSGEEQVDGKRGKGFYAEMHWVLAFAAPDETVRPLLSNGAYNQLDADQVVVCTRRCPPLAMRIPNGV